MPDKKIRGGYFQIARQIFNSDIWKNKPSSWIKVWIYILGHVNHKKTSDFDRGEGYFNFSEDRKNIGLDISRDQIKKIIGWLRTSTMISTTKSTRGMRIKVLRYEDYQCIENYTSTTKSTSVGTVKAPEKHQRSTTINKNVKNEKNDNISSEPSSQEESPPKKEIVQRKLSDPEKLIDFFYQTINPEIVWGNKTTRKAAEIMTKRYGVEGSISMAKKMIEAQMKDKFAPRVTTPHQMMTKVSAYKFYFLNNTNQLREIKEL